MNNNTTLNYGITLDVTDAITRANQLYKSIETLGVGKKARVEIESQTAKMKLSELKAVEKQMRSDLEKAIKINADVSSINKIKSSLAEVQKQMSGLKMPEPETQGGFFSKILGGELGSIGGKIGGLMAGVGVAVGGTEIAKKVYEISTSFQDLQTSMESAFQSAEKGQQVFESVTQYAKKMPYSVRELAEGVVVAKNFGIEAEKNIPAIADLAAKMRVSIPEAASSWGRAFAGGAAASDIFRERGILNLIKEFKGIDDLTKLSLPEFRQAMQDAFTDPTAGIAGATEKLSKNMAGQMSNMIDSAEAFANSIGKKVLPFVGKLAEGVGGLFEALTPVESNFDKASIKANTLKDRFLSLAFNVEALGDKTNKTADEQKLYQDSIQSLLNEYPNYFKNLDVNKSSFIDIMNAIRGAKDELNNYTESLIKNAIIADKQAKIVELGKKKYEAVQAEYDAYNKFDKYKSEGKLDKPIDNSSMRGLKAQDKTTYRDEANSQLKKALEDKKNFEAEIAKINDEINNVPKVLNYTAPKSEKKAPEQKNDAYENLKRSAESDLTEIRRLEAITNKTADELKNLSTLQTKYNKEKAELDRIDKKYSGKSGKTNLFIDSEKLKDPGDLEAFLRDANGDLFKVRDLLHKVKSTNKEIEKLYNESGELDPSKATTLLQKKYVQEVTQNDVKITEGLNKGLLEYEKILNDRAILQAEFEQNEYSRELKKAELTRDTALKQLDYEQELLYSKQELNEIDAQEFINLNEKKVNAEKQYLAAVEKLNQKHRENEAKQRADLDKLRISNINNKYDSEKESIEHEYREKVRIAEMEITDATIRNATLIELEKEKNNRIVDLDRRTWAERNKLAMAGIDSTIDGLTSLWDSLTQDTHQAVNAWDAAWQAIRNTFFRRLGEMISSGLIDSLLDKLSGKKKGGGLFDFLGTILSFIPGIGPAIGAGTKIIGGAVEGGGDWQGDDSFNYGGLLSSEALNKSLKSSVLMNITNGNINPSVNLSKLEKQNADFLNKIDSWQSKFTFKQKGSDLHAVNDRQTNKLARYEY